VTRVLVIDDEAPIRLLCRVNLEAEKMEVLEAADGPSGLEKATGGEARRHPPRRDDAGASTAGASPSSCSRTVRRRRFPIIFLTCARRVPRPRALGSTSAASTT
jgi:CheY-like chemotaxis protein